MNVQRILSGEMHTVINLGNPDSHSEIPFDRITWKDLLSLARALGPPVPTLSHLTCLNLRNNNLGPRGAQILTESLATTRTLTSLHLAANELLDEGAKYLQFIYYLLIIYYYMYFNFASTVQRSVKECECDVKFFESEFVTKFFVRDTTVSVPKISYKLQIFFFFEYEKIRQKWNVLPLFFWPNYSFFHIHDLVRAMCYQPNAIIDFTRYLADLLDKNTSVLLELFLTSNIISDEGAELLATALCKNTSLTLLDLSENFIRDVGAAALVNAVQANRYFFSISRENYLII
jgi:hypothetical protein